MKSNNCVEKERSRTVTETEYVLKIDREKNEKKMGKHGSGNDGKITTKPKVKPQPQHC